MKIKEAIRESGITSNESRILLAHALGYSEEYLLMNGDEEIDSDKYFELVERRKSHEPIAYIIGKKEFYSREFIVDSSVLIPRPDSEIMVDVVIRHTEGSSASRKDPVRQTEPVVRAPHTHTQGPYGRDKSLPQDDVRILELGIGSGCLLLTLLWEMPNATGQGVDISEAAINIATQNMEKFELSDRCKIYKSNWFEKVDGKFDVIISNPPYINKDDQNIMAKETLLHEPVGALYSEKGGFADYRKIASQAKNYLNENGKIFLEIGIGQKNSVAKIFEEKGFVLESIHKDLAGIERVVCLCMSSRNDRRSYPGSSNKT